MTAGWTALPLLSLDTETTGVDPETDRIVEAAAVTINPDGQVIDIWRRIVNPGIEIPEGAANIHGITTARAVAEGCDPTEALTELAGILKRHDGAVVIYQARFDWPLIHNEARRHSIDMPGALILDPLVLDRHLDKYRRGSRKLIDTARHYGIELAADDAHGATSDATASGLTMLRLMAAEPRIAAMGPTFDEPLGWPLPHQDAA